MWSLLTDEVHRKTSTLPGNSMPRAGPLTCDQEAQALTTTPHCLPKIKESAINQGLFGGND